MRRSFVHRGWFPRVVLTLLLVVGQVPGLVSAASLESRRPDVDGSGTTDLVWRNVATGQTALWTMNGVNPIAQSFLMSDPTWVVTATGDFNGDGKSDLVWRSRSTGQTVLWLMNGGVASATGFVMNDPAWSVVATGDFDGDGRTDLVWRHASTGQTVIWLMNGVTRTGSAFVMGDPAWSVVAVGDFNGDGKTDLVWRHRDTGQTAVWLMNGLSMSAGATIMGDPMWSAVATGDFNGDGKTDLVWRHAVTGQTVISLMNGAAISSSVMVMGDPNWAPALTADLDGDGKTDIVWTNLASGQTAVWLMNGAAPVSTAIVLNDPAWRVAGSGDYNGDGKADLLFRNEVSGHTALWLMDGTSITSTGFVMGNRAWAVRIDGETHDHGDAARFLAHATFGSSREEIARVAAIGPDAWLQEQFDTPASSFTNYVYPMLTGGQDQWAVNSAAIWRQLFEGPDQLRLRVMFALSEILVVSMENNTVQDAYCGPTSYLDMLAQNAFGNFQTLLKSVALHPIMGEYLNMKGSAKSDAVTGQSPNENFPRELLQLFSIGTVMLNADGTVKRDAGGAALPTYDQSVVLDFARAFSGWNHAGQDQTKSWRWLYPDTWDTDHLLRVQKACPAWSQPMQPWLANYRSADNTRDIAGPAHDAGAKQLLVYPGAASALPGGQTPTQDVDGAIANIFNHPNVGTFVGRQLIQRLVTSNPGPGYVARVTAAFNDNGAGVRGDLKAVIKAILRDPEAAGMQFTQRAKWGKLREPVVRFVQAHRAFKSVVNNVDHYYKVWELNDASDLAQDVLRAPSVFNFFSPRYAPSSGFGADGSSAPEFQITTTDSVAGYADFSRWGIVSGFRSWEATSVPSYWIKPDYSYYTGIAANAEQLVRELDLVLSEGSLSPEFRRALIASLAKINASSAAGRDERVKTALWMLLNTPDSLVQR
ncbi:MAG: DUF1800 family protein [Casimicrobiaceae bacterium]